MYTESFVFGAECCSDDIERNVAQLAAQTINALVLENPAQGSAQAIHKFNTLRWRRIQRWQNRSASQSDLDSEPAEKQGRRTER
jgi:hypothetical protein